jgi:hypothetical protein
MLRDRGDLLAIGLTGLLLLVAVLSYWPGPSAISDPVGQAGAGSQGRQTETASLEPLAEWLRPGRTRAQNQTVRQASPLEDYRLIGLVETEDQTVVLVSGYDGVVSLRLGEELDGFVLVEITGRGARFDQGSQSVLLELNE